MTLFLKDTALAHAHLGVATRPLAFAQRLPMDVDAWCARPPVAVNLSFALDSYQSETCWRFGRCYGNESWKRANVRPFGAWLRSHGTAPVRNMPRGQVQACYGGFFAASRRAVQATPQRTYAAIEEELTQADSLEEGHYMERTWPTAFGLEQPLHPRGQRRRRADDARARDVERPRVGRGVVDRAPPAPAGWKLQILVEC